MMREASPDDWPVRAGDEFGDDGADQRQAAGDPQPAEEIGHRGRQPEMPELLPAAWRR